MLYTWKSRISPISYNIRYDSKYTIIHCLWSANHSPRSIILLKWMQTHHSSLSGSILPPRGVPVIKMNKQILMIGSPLRLYLKLPTDYAKATWGNWKLLAQTRRKWTKGIFCRNESIESKTTEERALRGTVLFDSRSRILWDVGWASLKTLMNCAKF